ncbi:MAG TPA: isoprenylcysteine carboxylmethyltransferase family protein, partial [Planctomycetaceae bacterium]|nr:isoprenylcysteine carboxylmethyltransferase family protein [Planctomycetaceae bacterium]
QWVLYGLFATGILIVLVTTFLIDHFDLFGMRQVWLYFRGKPYTPIAFRQPGVYKLIRHPLYVGWILSFWATPTMSVVHLAFAAGMTAYILIAIYFEERNLAEAHGADYENYRRNVPMFIPRLNKSDSREAVPSQVEQV